MGLLSLLGIVFLGLSLAIQNAGAIGRAVHTLWSRR